MNEGNVLVVVEDSLCDASGNHAPVIHPEPIVPVDSRRELTSVQVAKVEAEGREYVPLGPADFQAVTQAVVSSVDQALGRVGSTRVARVGSALRVVAGESAFLDKLVDVKPETCPYLSSEGWTVNTAQYCILDQIGGGVWAPRQMFPGWAGHLPNQLTGDDIPLLDALIRLYTVNGVQPLAMFFLSTPGRPEGFPSRRLSLEVHYPRLPDLEPGDSAFEEDYPGRPVKVFREIPGDDD